MYILSHNVNLFSRRVVAPSCKTKPFITWAFDFMSSIWKLDWMLLFLCCDIPLLWVVWDVAAFHVCWLHFCSTGEPELPELWACKFITGSGIANILLERVSAKFPSVCSILWASWHWTKLLGIDHQFHGIVHCGTEEWETKFWLSILKATIHGALRIIPQFNLNHIAILFRKCGI